MFIMKYITFHITDKNIIHDSPFIDRTIGKWYYVVILSEILSNMGH